MNNRTTGIFSAIALAIIAVNMTISNMRQPAAVVPEPSKPEEKVVQVVGRVTSVFDGLGAETGFLVKDGNELRVVPCDPGSLMSQKGFQPEYLTVMKWTNGQTSLNALTVDRILK